MRAYRQPQRGFTLVELLVSLVIMSFGLIALSQLYMAATWTYTKARYLSVATARANFEMEMVRNLGYTGLQAGLTELGASYPTSQYTAMTSPKTGVTFTVPDLPSGTGSVEWAYYPTPGMVSKLYRVDIWIHWAGKVSAQSKVHVITFVAEGATN